MSPEVMLASVSERKDGFCAACDRLLRLIKLLRSPDGCQWDRKQTPLSMRTCLVEELFEVTDALTREDISSAREELGDLVFDVLLTAYMYEQNGDFSIADSLNDVTDKLIRRHPHVFAGKDYVSGTWDKIKRDDEGRKKDSVLDEVPDSFPPMLKAFKYLKKAAGKNFDWKNASDVIGKVKEELCEVEEAGGQDDKSHLEEEIGDLLLSAVNLSRFYGIDPDIALSRANSKFYERFTYVEKAMEEHGIPMTAEHLSDMEMFWQSAKQANDLNKSGL